MKSHGAIIATILSNAKGSEAKGEVLQAIQKTLPGNPEIADAALTREVVSIVLSGGYSRITQEAGNTLGLIIEPRLDLAKKVLGLARTAAGDPRDDFRSGAQGLLRVAVSKHSRLAKPALAVAESGITDKSPFVRHNSLYALVEITKVNHRLVRDVMGAVKDAVLDHAVSNVAVHLLKEIEQRSKADAARSSKAVARRPVAQKATPKKTAPSEWRGYAIF